MCTVTNVKLKSAFTVGQRLWC